MLPRNHSNRMGNYALKEAFQRG